MVPSEPKVRIDVYVDLLCADSASAWPVLKEFMNSKHSSGTDIDNLVELYLHIYPLA